MPLPLIGAAIGAAIGIAGSIGKMIGRGVANKKMRNLLKQDPTYSENPIARQRLGLAQTMLNARMPGAQAVQNNIYGSQANTLSNIQRGATDSSQALALASGVQGNTNDAFGNLGIQEASDYQRRYGNLSDAQEGVVREGDKVFQDQTRRFGNKMQVQGAINENKQNNWGDVAGMGFGLADFAMKGGLDGLKRTPEQKMKSIGLPQVQPYNRPVYNPATGRIE